MAVDKEKKLIELADEFGIRHARELHSSDLFLVIINRSHRLNAGQQNHSYRFDRSN